MFFYSIVQVLIIVFYLNGTESLTKEDWYQLKCYNVTNKFVVEISSAIYEPFMKCWSCPWLQNNLQLLHFLCYMTKDAKLWFFFKLPFKFNLLQASTLFTNFLKNFFQVSRAIWKTYWPRGRELLSRRPLASIRNVPQFLWLHLVCETAEQLHIEWTVVVLWAFVPVVYNANFIDDLHSAISSEYTCFLSILNKTTHFRHSHVNVNKWQELTVLTSSEYSDSRIA